MNKGNTKRGRALSGRRGVFAADGGSQRGHSLIATSLFIIVLGLFTLAGTGMYKIYSHYHNQQETAQRMQEIQTALADFSGRYGYYPCPAPLNAGLDTPEFGMPVAESCDDGDYEGTQYDSERAVRIGALPVRVLNIPDSYIADTWRNRFVYAVTADMARPGADLSGGEGRIGINDKNNNSVTAAPDNAVYALISTGNDSNGAYSMQGQEQSPCTKVNRNRANCSGDAVFLSSLLRADADNAQMFTSIVAFHANMARYEWYTGNWGSCIGTCESGVKKRIVECRTQNGKTVGEERCGSVPKPVDTESCALKACTWKMTPWSECSNNCGTGMKTRTVTCTQPDSGEIVEEGMCKILKPETSMGCEDTSGCVYKWKTGAWSECSAECNGKKTRTVSCILEQTNQTVPESFCGNSKPPVQIACEDAKKCGEVIIRPPPICGGGDNNCEERPPTTFCFFHVSGALIAHQFVTGWFTEIGKVDPYSNLVGPGSYDRSQPFANAHAHTFDGIAFGRDTRVTIYSKPNFQGSIILDQKGPGVINNHIWQSSPQAQNGWKTSTWPGTFHGQFPPSSRQWSTSNMHAWGAGTSVKVTCDD